MIRSNPDLSQYKEKLLLILLHFHLHKTLQTLPMCDAVIGVSKICIPQNVLLILSQTPHESESEIKIQIIKSAD